MALGKAFVLLLCLVANVPLPMTILYAIYAVVSTIADIEEKRKVKENQDYIDRNL